MKTSEKRRQADYILLYTILGKYLEKGIGNGAVAPRFLEVENINEIVEPFDEIKRLIQRIEWLDDGISVRQLKKLLEANRMSVEELMWAVEMFALDKQNVVARIEKGIGTNE